MMQVTKIGQEAMAGLWLRPAIEAGKASPSLPKLIAEWVGEVKTVYARGPANTITLAKLIAGGKRRLPYGAWTQIWNIVPMPFSKRKADNLAVIGKNLAWIDSQTSANLPSGWTILYQLALLDRPTLVKLIGDGTIHPEVTLTVAKALVARFRGRTLNRKSKRPNVKRHFGKLEGFIFETLSNWPQADREWAPLKLRELADLIDAHAVDSGFEPESHSTFEEQDLAHAN